MNKNPLFESKQGVFAFKRGTVPSMVPLFLLFSNDSAAYVCNDAASLAFL
jgi:hypothetical protein